MCAVRAITLTVVAILPIALPRFLSAHQPGAKAEKHRVPVRKIVFDTDPGGDDSFALLWLQSLAHQKLCEIVAVTTVGGNVGSRQTFRNASKVLALGGFGDVELGRCSVGDDGAVDAAHIHGADGMGNQSKSLPPAAHDWEKARRSEDIIVELLNRSPNEITLVAVGPLTNLAAAEEKRPGTLAKAKEVVVMGGAFNHRGNITPQAEFNIYCDPEAAEVVFASSSNLVVLPLDVTTQINFTSQHVAAVTNGSRHSSTARFLDGLSKFLIGSTLEYRETAGKACFHVHDAATLAYLFYPQTLLFRRGLARVETKGRWTRGQTILDQRHGARRAANAWVAQQVDAANLLAILVQDLKVLCDRKPSRVGGAVSASPGQ